MQTVSVISMGCAKNQVHSETMMGAFQQAGYRLTEQYDEADTIVINTCGFIDAAKAESIQTILEMAQWKEEGACRQLVVVGCLVQKYAEELAKELPEVDLFVGTNNYMDIVQVLHRYEESRELQPQQVMVHDHWTKESEMGVSKRVLTTPKHYAYLRISEGCDNHCTYCVIPQMQGPYRSRSIEQLTEEAKQLVAEGVTELILVGQDTSYYGKDLYGEFKLVELLKALAAIPEVHWIRILYAYPNNFTEELIDYIARESKVCKYLDIPMQHADSDVLHRMNRKITEEELRSLIASLRQRIPGIVLRSTFIVGFPGETEAQYQHLLDFLEEEKLDCVGAFPYSQEEGTIAARMDGQWDEDTKEWRAENLMAYQFDNMYERHMQAIGTVREVKVDEWSPDVEGLLLCRSQGEAPEVDPWILVEDAEGNYQPGDYLTVEIVGLDEYDFVGVIHR